MPLQIRPLTAAFGAEVTGFRIADGVDPETFAAIEAAFNEHSVLVLPGQPLDDLTQIAFSERFGPLEGTLSGAVGAHTKLARIANVLPDGTIKDPDSQLALFTRANLYWHTDSSFKAVPAMASLLSARELPPEGGDTEFASTRAGYEALPEDMRRRLDGIVATHWIVHSRLKLSPDAVTERQRRELPPVPQALVRTNPVTGRKSLTIGSHVCAMSGMSDAEARALNDELVAHCTQPCFTYRHKWRDHDLVIWDNRAILHRGHPYDEVNTRRILIRTTVAGTGPTVVDGEIVEAA